MSLNLKHLYYTSIPFASSLTCATFPKTSQQVMWSLWRGASAQSIIPRGTRKWNIDNLRLFLNFRNVLEAFCPHRFEELSTTLFDTVATLEIQSDTRTNQRRVLRTNESHRALLNINPNDNNAWCWTGKLPASVTDQMISNVKVFTKEEQTSPTWATNLGVELRSL